jgi:hypothetical protein
LFKENSPLPSGPFEKTRNEREKVSKKIGKIEGRRWITELDTGGKNQDI